MKNFKIISILFISLLAFSCSGDDDNGDDSDPEATFLATINGAGYTNYEATLGSYSATGNIGFTIAVTDANNNIVRLFMNSTGGFSGGVTKEIGNIDGDGFGTNALFRDQTTQLTYNSISGTISITKNLQSNNDPSNRLMTGNFNIMASINTGETITISGNFENIPVFGL